ncbi:MAG: hypothetical protein IPK02_09365 [Candidatus Accumulibacter sp.]|uniref:Uncharacterized protein n=1 Tax=Candidatus Accumulibacter affinis TaxID=2954384 RepID=A0A935TH77_9PROT|nr:hypothetical protein [Candidatus Accumulibacter affinis]
MFEIMGAAMLRYPKPTGVINMIRPAGTRPVPAGFTGGGAVDAPWGLNLDGNNNVWIGSLTIIYGAAAPVKGPND